MLVRHPFPPGVYLCVYGLDHFSQSIDQHGVFRVGSEALFLYLLPLLKLEEALYFDEHPVLVHDCILREAEPLQQTEKERDVQLLVLGSVRLQEIDDRLPVEVWELSVV